MLSVSLLNPLVPDEIVALRAAIHTRDPGKSFAWNGAGCEIQADSRYRLEFENPDQVRICRGDEATSRNLFASISLLQLKVEVVNDRFATIPLCYRTDQVCFADRADLIANSGEVQAQALFDYLHFHMIPAPRTIFNGVACSSKRIPTTTRA